MKERPGSHFKLMFMADQMMLRQVFPLKRYYHIATFPRLSLQIAHTSTSHLYITCSRSKPFGKMMLQTGKARLRVQQLGFGALVVCHNI